MLCVFCEHDSSSSRSVEHIIPESLGNKDHILRRGIVCDKCNNYFASKIEGPALSSVYFTNLRSRQDIENKRGIIPDQYAFFPQAGIPVALRASREDGIFAGAWREKDDALFVRAIAGISRGAFLVPLSMPVDERLLSRFIAKIGIEIYIARALDAQITVEQMISSAELKLIRRFVRRGDYPARWPLNSRRIYGEDKIFLESGPAYQVLHEFNLLLTDEREMYAVVCIFGEEFAINLGGPSIEGYHRWLSSNGNRSPLYMDSV